jgi:putative ABC transport system permease protein
MVQRFLNMFRRRRLDRQLHEELQYHLDALEEEHRARGLSGNDARAAARRDMGSLAQVTEAYREQRGLPRLDILWRDVRFGARSLRRTPGLSAAVIATLAIAIGATTAVFAIVNGVLLEPLPYPNPAALVALTHRSAADTTDIPSAPYLYFTFREQNRTLDSIGLWRTFNSTITGLERPEQVRTVGMTSDVLTVLGIAPLAGRSFSRADEDPGSPPTAILTYGYWQRRFGGDPSIVGRRLVINGQSSDVIGAMPRTFRFLDIDADVLLPFQLDRSQVTLGRYVFQSIARLKAGATADAAMSDLARLVPIAVETFPPPAGYRREQFGRNLMMPRLTPLKDALVAEVARMLWVLMASLALLLVLASANVANLLVVRADGRRQELAVRAALGASRARIVGELLTESLLLGVAAGLVGLAFAFGALRLVIAWGPADLPRVGDISIDGAVLLFTLGIALLAGAVLGLLPARKATALPGVALRSSRRSITDGRDRLRLRGVLVAVQVAIAVVLLVGSGLMIRTFAALTRVDPGFKNASEVQLAHIQVGMPEPERTTRIQHRIVERLMAIPGVASVAFADLAPLDPANVGNDTVLMIEGQVAPSGRPRPLRRFEFVSPGFFRTLGTPMVAGRDLTWTDLYEGRPVALVSQRLARDEWGSVEAALYNHVRASPADPWREIVGVTGDLRDDGMSAPPTPFVFFPALVSRFWGTPAIAFGSATFAIRSARAGSATFLDEVQQAVWDVDPDLPIAKIRTLESDYGQSLSRISFTLALLLLAGTMGLLLGFIGIYGVIAHGVAQRAREIGIRLALGAQRAQIERIFVRDGLALAGTGVTAGVATALLATRLMSSLLFGVTSSDPLTYCVIVPVVVFVAALAAYVPARRAMGLNPIDTLRA